MVGTYEQFARSISFRVVQPWMRVPWNVGEWLRTKGVLCEKWNVRVARDERGVRDLVASCAHVPRMSTIAVGCLLNAAVRRMRPSDAYVNVGVWHGFSLLAAMAGNDGKICVGVDNFSEFGGPRREFLRRFEEKKGPAHRFHDTDYRAYFRDLHVGPIGVYFYDGNHAYEHQIEGLRAAEPFFAPGCVVIVDDVNWDDPRRACRDFLAEHPGEYRVLLDARTSDNCHPTWWNGVMVLQKEGSSM